MTTDNTRQDLILNAWRKIGSPQLTDDILKIISVASGKTVQEIKNTIQKEKNG